MRVALVVLSLSSLLTAASAVAAEGWRLLGSEGAIHMVVLEQPAELEAEIYHSAVAEICGSEPVCQVMFWVEGNDAPDSLPMTPAQVRSKVAHWQFSSKTGVQRYLWNCAVYPSSPYEQCM